jgi:hypothetical protein
MNIHEKINARAAGLRSIAPAYLNGSLPILAWLPYLMR